jgi:D-alanyl-D-alanine carboxypeptidase
LVYFPAVGWRFFLALRLWMLDGARTRFSMCVKALPLLAAALSLIFLTDPALARHHRWHGGKSIGGGLTDPDKDAALIVDGESGKVLYARNAAAERHPASLTKMMTLYLLFDALKKGQVTMATELPISAHAAAQRPTKMYLQPGDSIPVDAAIRAIVVRSANDVAVAIAESLGGTEGHFAEMMTAKARQLGMTDTFYHNASGLPDPLQISTANDLAKLARHLGYDFPQYFHYFSTPGFTYRGVTYPTHDNLIGRYDGADGIKTGYTEASGFNLVSSVVRGRTHLIGVVMGGRTAHRRDREMMNLLDQAFAQIQQNPALVASAKVPWQTVAQNATPPAASGVDLAPPSARGPAPTMVASNTDDDEDNAEAHSDDEEQSGGNVIAPAPTPAPIVGAPPSRPAAPPPAAQAVADAIAKAAPPMAHPPTPSPKPAAPVMVAAYHPPKPKPPVAEGDYSDDTVTASTAKLRAQDWTIQIGAFTDSQIAHAQLANYAERSMDVLGQAARIVVPFKAVDGQTLFRARFGPFVEREAREICSRLTQRGQTCFAALATR